MQPHHDSLKFVFKYKIMLFFFSKLGTIFITCVALFDTHLNVSMLIPKIKLKRQLIHVNTTPKTKNSTAGLSILVLNLNM